MQGDADRPLVQVPCSDSTAGISGFTSNSAVQYLSSDDSDSQEERMLSVLWMKCMLRLTGRSLNHMFATAHKWKSMRKFWQ